MNITKPDNETIINGTITNNELCNTSSWNILDGDWKFSATDCSVQAWDWPAPRNLMWVGSADGLTPSNQYNDDNFTLTVTLSVPTQQGGAGVVFRMNSSLAKDYYFLYLHGHGDIVGLGRGCAYAYDWTTAYWEPIENVSVSSIESNVVYELTVQATGTSYDVYFNGELIMNGIQLPELQSGSVGLQTSYSQATFYALQYTGSSARYNALSTTTRPRHELPPICFY